MDSARKGVRPWAGGAIKQNAKTTKCQEIPDESAYGYSPLRTRAICAGAESTYTVPPFTE